MCSWIGKLPLREALSSMKNMFNEKYVQYSLEYSLE